MSDLISREWVLNEIREREQEPNYQHESEDWCVGLIMAENIVDSAPTIEAISTDCVNVNKVIEEACAIWKANDGDTAMQTLIDWLKEYCPRVIAVPRKHGRWKPYTDKDGKAVIGKARCSVCGGWYEHISWVSSELNYCPNCGSRMDEVEK